MALPAMKIELPRISLWVIAVLAAFIVSSAAADAPEIKSTVPQNGSKDIAAGPTTIRIEFDRDMDTASGFSIMRDAERPFPKLDGQARWEDARTFLMPVQLDPETEYGLGINSADPKFQRFRSKQGVPAKPSPLAFTTAAVAPRDGRQLAAANKKAIEQLRAAIDTRYSYRDLRKVDWPKAFAEFRKPLEEASSPEEFAETAAKLLARAEDVHLWLEVGGQRIATREWPTRANFDPAWIRENVPGFKKLAPSVGVGRFDGTIEYVVLSTFAEPQKADLEAAAKHIAALDETARLILDVRPNAGGSELLAREIAGLFVDHKVAYAKSRNRDPQAAGGFSKLNTREVSPRADGLKFRGKGVAVLVGPRNGSSCEAFLLMMKQAPGARLIGERTMGASGNPQPVQLANGVSVFVPSWQAFFPDGSPLEGRGIPPDVAVDAGGADFSNSDPVLQRAVEMFREK